jgi:hypothetical protein
VEIKPGECVDEHDVRELSRILQDFPGAEAFCLSRNKVRKRIGDVLAVLWQEGLAELDF